MNKTRLYAVNRLIGGFFIILSETTHGNEKAAL